MSCIYGWVAHYANKQIFTTVLLLGLLAVCKYVKRKEDELEKVIREIKKLSKKRQNDEPSIQPRGKRARMEIDCSNYGGSHEHLLFVNSDSYNEAVELAIDEALRLCGEIDCDIPVSQESDLELVKTLVSDLPVELVKNPVSDLPVELVEMPVPNLPVGLVEMKEGMVGGADGGRGRVGELSEWAGSCENSDTVVSRVEQDRHTQETGSLTNSIMVCRANGGRVGVREMSGCDSSCDTSDTVVSRVEIDRPDQGTSCMINSIMKSGADNNMIGEQTSGCMPVSLRTDETHGCASDSSNVVGTRIPEIDTEETVDNVGMEMDDKVKDRAGE